MTQKIELAAHYFAGWIDSFTIDEGIEYAEFLPEDFAGQARCVAGRFGMLLKPKSETDPVFTAAWDKFLDSESQSLQAMVDLFTAAYLEVLA